MTDLNKNNVRDILKRFHLFYLLPFIYRAWHKPNENWNQKPHHQLYCLIVYNQKIKKRRNFNFKNLLKVREIFRILYISMKAKTKHPENSFSHLPYNLSILQYNICL